MPITLSLTSRTDPSLPRLTRADAYAWLGHAAGWFENLGDAVLDARVVRDADDKAVLIVLFLMIFKPGA